MFKYIKFTLLVLISAVIFQCSQDVELPKGKIVEPADPKPEPEPDPGTEPTTYKPGEKVYGHKNYVEFIAGHPECPIIITAPHGGYEKPGDIAKRVCSGCVTEADANTQELARKIAEEFEAKFGMKPHVVINKLHREKLDPNRQIGEAALGNSDAEKAYQDYHKFISDARVLIEGKVGHGLLLDMHGHGHPIQRVEVGYLLSKENLEQSDQFLDGLKNSVSVRNIVDERGVSVSQLLRGPDSFGSLLYIQGYPAVPSVQDPKPGLQNPYFEGGYTTEQHGSLKDGKVSAIQLECYKDGIRNTADNREAFAKKLAIVVQSYFKTYYNIEL